MGQVLVITVEIQTMILGCGTALSPVKRPLQLDMSLATLLHGWALQSNALVFQNVDAMMVVVVQFHRSR